MIPYMKYAVRSEKDVLLCVRYYKADVDKTENPKYPIVLVHGLMNSADLYDIPGAPRQSLAKRLQNAGHDVYTYDQRGAGDSQINNWRFGLAENAFIDLPQIIAFALERSKARSVILGGYSLGGLIIFLFMTFLLKYETTLRHVRIDHIEKIFTLASPGVFLPRRGRWKHLYSRGEKIAKKMSAIVDRADFLKAQIYIYDPALNNLLPKFMIHAALKFAAASPFTAGLVKSLPIPSFLYRSSDFDRRTFRSIVRSKVLDRSSKQLFSEIFQHARSGGNIKVTVPHGQIDLPTDFDLWKDIPLLMFSSQKDELVQCEEVKPIAGAVNGAVHHIIDEVFPKGCGHSGFVFNREISSFVVDKVLNFIK
ncbi:alpha/beta fold hydrolase [candidate division KSB1 bacterium]|nr:alpha/beta fold hydrolase [candidate division KSB1 bacterium]